MAKKKNIVEIFGNFRDISTLGIASIASSVIGGLFWLFLAGLIGAEIYGEISYIIAIAGIAATISYIGAGNTLIVFTTKGEKIQAPVSLITIVLSSLASIVLFLMFFDAGASLYVIGFVVFGLVSSELLGRKDYTKYSIYIISQRLIMAALGILFYFIIGTEGVILGIGISFFPYSFRLFKLFKNSKLDFQLLQSKKKFMINSYMLDLRGVFAGSIDKIIIVPLLGFFVLGNYQLGIQIFSVLLILPTIVFQYTVPQNASGNQNSKLKLITILISIGFSALSIFLAPQILPTLFPEFVEAVQVVQIMSLAVVPSTVVLMYLSRFLGEEKNKIMVLGTVIYLIIQISGIMILGKMYGINGVAAAIVLASSGEAIYFIVLDKLKGRDF